MKNMIALVMLTLAAIPAFADASRATSAPGFCVNYAKSGAIRAYKSEVGTVQGSDGIQYSAKLIAASGNVASYVVSISDNNEDGETWTFDYAVRVQKQGAACKVLQVKKLKP